MVQQQGGRRKDVVAAALMTMLPIRAREGRESTVYSSLSFFSFLTWISSSKDLLVILAVLQPVSYSSSLGGLGGFFQVSVILSYGTSDILLWQKNPQFNQHQLQHCVLTLS